MKGNCDYMVGKKLRELRENAGLTQKELAQIITKKTADIISTSSTFIKLFFIISKNISSVFIF